MKAVQAREKGERDGRISPATVIQSAVSSHNDPDKWRVAKCGGNVWFGRRHRGRGAASGGATDVGETLSLLLPW